MQGNPQSQDSAPGIRLAGRLSALGPKGQKWGAVVENSMEGVINQSCGHQWSQFWSARGPRISPGQSSGREEPCERNPCPSAFQVPLQDSTRSQRQGSVGQNLYRSVFQDREVEDCGEWMGSGSRGWRKIKDILPRMGTLIFNLALMLLMKTQHLAKF